MIEIVKKINNKTIKKLFDIYSEAMAENLENGQYINKENMLTDYEEFLKDFIAKPNHLIIIEKQQNIWVSGLRAIETKQGHWHIEAVETRPDSRKKGHASSLLINTLKYLSSIGMKSVDCCIGQNNLPSQKLHKNCGFVCTNKSPIYNGKPSKTSKIYFYDNKDLQP